MLEKSKHAAEPHAKTKPEYLKIRAHHLCCIQGFQGYGYSSAFVDNMKAVISDLKKAPSKPLELVSTCDAICTSCPSKKECSAQKSIFSRRIRSMDIAVMKKLKIKEGAVMEADEAFRSLNSKLNNASDVEDVCGTCKWKHRCLWYTQATRQEIPKN
jgi:hypothetical protein